MLVDGVELVASSKMDMKISSGTSFPASPLDSQMFRLTAISGPYVPGVYYYDGTSSSWLPADGKAIAGTAAGIALLDNTQHLEGSQIPSLSIINTFVSASQSAMLALTAQTGDVCIRSDLSQTYILQGSDPTVLANWVVMQSPVSVQAYDIATYIPGLPSAGATIISFTAVRAYTLPANLAGSSSKASTAAASQSVFTLSKNGVPFNSITFAAAGTSGTFGNSASTSFAVGDVLSIIAPSTQDATLANIGITLLGTFS